MPWRRPAASEKGLSLRAEDAAGGGARSRARQGALLVAALVSVGACAKQEPPPGSREDRAPPRPVRISPADGEVVPGFGGSLTVRFDEPVRVSDGYVRSVESSPAQPLRMDFGFSEIRLRPRDGWLEDAVYTFRLPPEVSDLMNNRMADTIRVTFSTGPRLTDTRVSGVVRDRVEKRSVPDARVLFLALAGDTLASDPVPYTARARSGGEFEQRFLPPGRYRALAFRDLNRSLALERALEPYDTARVVLEGPGDRSELDFWILEPDSTAPVLGRAEISDSVTLELTFDDELDPEQPLRPELVAVRDSATGEAWPVERLGLPYQLDAGLGAERTPAGAADPAAAGEEPVADRDGPVSEPPDTDVRLRVRLGRPVEERRTYTVTAEGIRNLWGLPGGGTVPVEPPAPPADSVAVPGDTTPSRTDGPGAPAPDTLGSDPKGSGSAGGATGGGAPEGAARPAGEAPARRGDGGRT